MVAENHQTWAEAVSNPGNIISMPLQIAHLPQPNSHTDTVFHFSPVMPMRNGKKKTGKNN